MVCAVMQELTEEGLPFVILFHDPIDTRTAEKYRQVVSKDLYTEKSRRPFILLHTAVGVTCNASCWLELHLLVMCCRFCQLPDG